MTQSNEHFVPERKGGFLKRYLADREMSPEERRSVLEDLFVFGKQNQTPFLVRMTVLLVLSTIIATAGLLADSAAVVIGAMLVAPLMNPVMAAAGAVVMGWSKRFYQSMWLVAAMGAGALILSSMLTLLSPELVFIPEQVIARTKPTYFDLLIALAAGSAGAYTITRKESSAIPGVAVAVALLPPLASAGILFTTGEGELGLRAVVLFLTNLVAMVLAGALTFIAVGVSPATARRHSAAFIKAKIWLFVVLTLAVSVPLWFYSNKVIFNAHYLAAKSDVLQHWLAENDLELVDIDIFRKNQVIVLDLQGPNPPVNMNKLHERLVEQIRATGIVEPEHFRIDYTWTPKVHGSWPLDETSIGEVTSDLRASANELVAKTWVWKVIQHGGGQAVRPDADDRYTLFFDHRGKFDLNAACGKMTGKYQLRGQSLDIEMNRNWFSGCRKDAKLEVLTGELQRARTVFIEGKELRIALAGDESIMYFERR